MTKELELAKEREREMLESINKYLSKLDEVQCEYYFDINDDDAPVFIFHQDASLVPLFILRPVYHCALEIKEIIGVEEYTCWEDAPFGGTEGNKFIMKFYKLEENTK